MPLPPAARFATAPRELLAAAAFSALLAAGLVLPKMVACALGGADPSCAPPPQGRWLLWLGLTAWNAGLWLLAMLSQPLLPAPGPGRRRGLALQVLGISLLSPALGAWLGLTDGHLLPRNLYEWQTQLMFSAVAALATEYRRQRHHGERDADTLRHETRQLARQLDQARSALLQAQVEPHFLFNTLAHLRRLAQTDPAAARGMLADLRHYLDSALPEMRQAQVPLARELALVRAFLSLHQRRIGPQRLALRFEVAPGLEDAVVPSTCLLTLAENAVKHGITPQVDGGEIAVRALPDPDQPGRLCLEVADTGAGMGPGSGSGTGLVTLRARLAALHGPQARLSLQVNQPRGLVARVQVPWSPA